MPPQRFSEYISTVVTGVAELVLVLEALSVLELLLVEVGLVELGDVVDVALVVVDDIAALSLFYFHRLAHAYNEALPSMNLKRTFDYSGLSGCPPLLLQRPPQ